MWGMDVGQSRCQIFSNEAFARSDKAEHGDPQSNSHTTESVMVSN